MVGMGRMKYKSIPYIQTYTRELGTVIIAANMLSSSARGFT